VQSLSGVGEDQPTKTLNKKKKREEKIKKSLFNKFSQSNIHGLIMRFSNQQFTLMTKREI